MRIDVRVCYVNGWMSGWMSVRVSGWEVCCEGCYVVWLCEWFAYVAMRVDV